MRNKISSKDNKRMSSAYVTTAKGMAGFLLSVEHKGPGDTIEAAAHRIQTRFGVPATLLMRLRHREVKDMLTSNFFALATAFNEAMERAERRVDEAYQHEKSLAVDPKIVRLAAALAGEKG